MVIYVSFGVDNLRKREGKIDNWCGNEFSSFPHVHLAEKVIGAEERIESSAFCVPFQSDGIRQRRMRNFQIGFSLYITIAAVHPLFTVRKKSGEEKKKT
jgi:hypothetical protein